MPNNNKKKTKSRNRSAAAVYCAACQKKLGAHERERCVCTRVNFCNQGCQRRALQTGQHECPGAPSTTNSMLPSSPRYAASPLNDPSVESQWKREHKETIMQHVQAIVIQEGMRGNLPKNPGAEYYARLADEQGSAPCAYMAGIQYKNRLLGKVQSDGQGGLQSTSTASHGQEGVLETDELAYKYLLQASQAGIGLAMQSLGELYIAGQGVRERRISGNDWLWHAVLIRSAGAPVLLDSNALIPLEINSMVGMMEQVRVQLCPGQSFSPSGPHLTSLMACFMKKLHERGFKLRPFAAAIPTLSVGSEVCRGVTGAVPMIGAEHLEQLCCLTDQLNQRGNKVEFVYGRRGIAKAATAQTHGKAKARIMDSFLYEVPPEPQCSEHFGGNEADAFYALLQELEFDVNCIHSEGTGRALCCCQQCTKLAEERLLAVSHGRVAISLYETLPARGRTAIWRDEEGNLQSDTFKVYCRGEAEQALAALVECEPRLAHPLFIAQDPNFLWPLIVYHGTVRAALEYVAPHEDWNTRLGDIKPTLERQSIVDDATSGKILARCGNNLCRKLEGYKKRETLGYRCGRCEARLYCSPECAVTDWIVHKNECSGGGVEAPRPIRASPDIVEPPCEGEEIVLHGLRAKPEFNGRVGVVSGSMNADGRYPVKLDGRSSVIGVKPANIYQLGISISARPGKARKHTCSAHRQEVCDDCSLDMRIVNHLSKLRYLNQVPTKEQVEEIAELNFASLEMGESCSKRLDENYPIECSGLGDDDKRFILKSLLKYAKDKEASGEALSSTSAAAINGLCCYSARTEAVVRPYAVEQLMKVNF